MCYLSRLRKNSHLVAALPSALSHWCCSNEPRYRCLSTRPGVRASMNDACATASIGTFIGVMGIGEMVLSEPCGRDEALGVGDTPGDVGCTLTTLSFEVRLGESLAGKLSVFVHCDRLRTILRVHKHNTYTDTATRGRGTFAQNGGRRTNAIARRIQTKLDAACASRDLVALRVCACAASVCRGRVLGSGNPRGPTFCLSMGRPPQLKKKDRLSPVTIEHYKIGKWGCVAGSQSALEKKTKAVACDFRPPRALAAAAVSPPAAHALF
ncbi:unnamed protein product, partial [Iphiclides podalirius]